MIEKISEDAYMATLQCLFCKKENRLMLLMKSFDVTELINMDKEVHSTNYFTLKETERMMIPFTTRITCKKDYVQFLDHTGLGFCNSCRKSKKFKITPDDKAQLLMLIV